MSCVGQAGTKIEDWKEHNAGFDSLNAKKSLSVIVDTYADAFFECGQVAADSTVAMTIGPSTAARELVRSGSTMTIASSADEAEALAWDNADSISDNTSSGSTMTIMSSDLADLSSTSSEQTKKKPRLDSDAVVLQSNESQALEPHAPDSQLW